MASTHRKLAGSLLLASCALLATSPAMAEQAAKPAPLVIQEQGSFAVGGTVITNPGTFDPYKPTPEGQTFHGDHAYVFYQIPVNARKLPLVMWHGAGQFSKSWETTSDGREGYQNIFLRRGFGVYLIDQPRRGNAGRSTVQAAITPTPDEQVWFDTFRIGVWPNYFPGVQFSRDPEALKQFFRSMTPNTGPFDVEVITNAVSALFDKIGPAILVTHSHGPKEEIRPGDVVWIPSGEKHWHGATATTAMTHIAIAEALDGKTVEWMEKVSDEQYR